MKVSGPLLALGPRFGPSALAASGALWFRVLVLVGPVADPAVINRRVAPVRTSEPQRTVGPRRHFTRTNAVAVTDRRPVCGPGADQQLRAPPR